MATNKIVLRSIIEFMQGYTPVYQPIYPLFLGKSQAFADEAGKIEFRRSNTIGDIRAGHIHPKMTDIKQISFNEGSKIFKKYFLANQFQISDLQDQKGLEDVVAQVLDEHQKQMDELFLLGEGTSTSTMLNNGLFWSNDPNWKYYGSGSEATVSSLETLHSSIQTDMVLADQVAGRKSIILYGVGTLAKFNAVYTSYPVPFKKVLADSLPGVSLVKLPPSITPTSAEGWIIVNHDQVKLNYTRLPALMDQGLNPEKMYAWFNFMMGSSMLEVLAQNAIIRRDATVT